MPVAIPILAKVLITTALSIAATAATSLLSAAISPNQKKNNRFSSTDNRQRQNITSTVASLPVVYGRSKVGGVRIFAQTKVAYNSAENVQGVSVSTQGDYLYLVTAFCEGEIDEIEKVYIDSIDSEDSKFNSPFKVDLTLNWNFDEPDPLTTYSRILFTTQYYWTYRYSPNWKYDYRDRSLYRSIAVTRYRLYRKNIQTNKEELILETTGGKSTLNLNNTDYGHYQYRLEYLRDNGSPTIVGIAEAKLTKNNNDFELISNNNLQITQNSYQEGEYIKSEPRLGHHTQKAIQFITQELPADYSNKRIGNKIAYIGHRFLKHTSGSQVNQSPIKRVPEITALIKGKKLYDPRKDPLKNSSATPNYQSVGDPNTYKWSDNPALCIRDFLTNTLYGFGLEEEYIDDESFMQMADYCDEPVSDSENNLSPRYLCNGVVDTSNTLIDNLKELLSSCNGHIIWSLGKWRLSIEKPNSPIFNFNQNNIIGNVQVTRPGIRSKQNAIKVKYFNPDLNYQFDIADISEHLYLQEDQNKKLELEYELPFTTSLDEAFRLGDIQLKKSRLGTKVQFKSLLSAYEIEAGDIVSFDYEPYGWQNKEFKILQSTLTPEGEIEFTAEEYTNTIYDTTQAIVKRKYLNSSLNNPFTVEPPSNLTFRQNLEIDYLGQYKNIANLTWVSSPSPNITNYQLEYKPIGFGEWEALGTTTSSQIDISHLPPGRHSIRLKAINSIGYESISIQKNIDIVNIQIPPPNVQNFELKSQKNDQIFVTWLPVSQIRNNGFYKIKHINPKDNAHWNDIANFEEIIDSKISHIMLPEMDGSYLIKSINEYGLESEDSSSIIVNTSNNNRDYKLINTYVYNDAFSGNKENCEALNQKLQCSNVYLFDDGEGFFDDMAGLFDDIGAGQYANQASYEADQYIDLGKKYHAIKINKTIQATSEIESLKTDQLTGLFDEKDGLFDNKYFAGNVNVLYATTDSDPASPSAIWSNWKVLTSNVDSMRGLKIRVEILKNQLEGQIYIDNISISLYNKQYIESGTHNITTENTAIAFEKEFYELEQILVNIDNPNSGDTHSMQDISKAGFSVSLYDNNSQPINKTMHYIAYGYGHVST